MENESEWSLALLTHRGGVSRTLHSSQGDMTSTAPRSAGLVPVWRLTLNSWGKLSPAQSSQEDSWEEAVGSGLATHPLPESLPLKIPLLAAFPHWVRVGACRVRTASYPLGWIEREAPQ